MWYSGGVTEHYKRHPNTICYLCKIAVYRRPSELEKANGRAFCSMACYGRYCRKEIACVVCGEFMLSSLNKKTCSRACANRRRSGTVYHRGKPDDKVTAQRALKIRLFRKRGLVCERCGYGVYQILQVHHKDRNRKNNLLSNLELICPNCHYAEHYEKNSWIDDWLKNGGVG